MSSSSSSSSQSGATKEQQHQEEKTKIVVAIESTITSNNEENNTKNNNKKRPAATTTTTEEESKDSKKHKQLRLDDVSTALGYKSGDRIEVQWDICLEGDDDNNNNDNNNNNNEVEEENNTNTNAGTTESTTTTTTKTFWWPGVLKKFDGRYHDNTFAIRTIDYDPSPENGFYYRSDEDVIFLDSNTIYSLEQQQELSFRREGDDEIITIPNVSSNSTSTTTTNTNNNNASTSTSTTIGEEGIRNVLDNILASALENNHKTWSKLDASQKAIIADKMSKGKEKLLNGLMKQIQLKKDKQEKENNTCENNSNTIITQQDVQQILADTFG